jgi:predicted XRE-type DNA-binding protein
MGDSANSPFALAAKALSLDVTALRTELQSGKTVADLAKAKGVDVNSIVTAIVDAHKTHIAQAVTDGKLTQAQADEILKNEQTRATDFVNGKVPPAGPRGPSGRGGQGGKPQRPGAPRASATPQI